MAICIFKFLDKDELLGIPLSIQLNDSTKSVKIFYSTTDESEALDWLSAEQTAYGRIAGWSFSKIGSSCSFKMEWNF